MNRVFSTFCATSLIWCGALLYCFIGGHVERHQPDYAEAMQAQLVSQQVHLKH